jgi:cytochrome c556
MPPPGGGAPGIRQIMGKVAKGPNSLNALLGAELKEASPPWETIQTQTKEYAQLAKELGTYDPPKGSKESWSKQTAAYAETAADLDKAAQAKDKDAAVAAHGELSNSCMACHREHRGGPGRGGPGMMGGPPGFRPGGPPPGGGPGGLPPGGNPPPR